MNTNSNVKTLFLNAPLQRGSRVRLRARRGAPADGLAGHAGGRASARYEQAPTL